MSGIFKISSLLRSSTIAFFALASLSGTATAGEAANPWATRYQQVVATLPAELPTPSYEEKTAFSAPNSTVKNKRETAKASQKSTQSLSQNSTHKIARERLNYSEVEEIIADHLIAEGAADAVKATILNRRSGALAIHSEPLSAKIENLTYFVDKSRWEATLQPYAAGQPLAQIELSGRYEELVVIPVLSRRLRSDETITVDDVEMKEFAQNKLRQNTVMDATALIGKSPQRGISPGRAIRKSDIVTPAIVRKNERITMHLKSDTMQITALGEALDSGAKGDTIRVRNSDSNVVIQAKVVSAGQVEVVPFGVLVASR